MLTRLKVTGFKNLVEVDVRFGPFTCVAGANGVGKSNLFDAIRFLSLLADHTLVEAALTIRDEGGRNSDVRSLFHRIGSLQGETMSFEVEMIIPPRGVDDLGQDASSSTTFLRYILHLQYRGSDSAHGPIEITREELSHINIGDASRFLLFPHDARRWRSSAVTGARRAPFISTMVTGQQCVIRLHQEGKGGRQLSRPAGSLPRTVLSATNAAENPTALLARREMQSWRLLQLEPSALRTPDPFNAPPHIEENGAHLPATLYQLALHEASPGAVCARVANRLADLVEDVREVWIDRDERREMLTLQVSDRNRTSHAAMALSDGTLRFLALAILEQDPAVGGLICLEEPENGIHPRRIPAILELLRAIATDPEEPVDADNPLRQVIVNTHSPLVVQQVPDASLLLAYTREEVRDGHRVPRAVFGGFPGTWRVLRGQAPALSKGQLLAYLEAPGEAREVKHSDRRVIDRPDVQELLFPFSEHG